jgi:predicted RNA binding protein YcfA (HicA-like mRNA interferase family)
VSPARAVVSGQETVTALKKTGFEEIGQRGSHVKLRNHRELARGTLAAILRQSEPTVSEFIDLL